jgi:hypothetical protein
MKKYVEKYGKKKSKGKKGGHPEKSKCYWPITQKVGGGGQTENIICGTFFTEFYFCV